jgi:arsenate reductase-like glutaredoxin family protein
LLLQKGLEVSERDFFKDTLSETEIRELASIAGTENIFARRSPSLKKLGLADNELSDDEMVNLMLQEPKLVRRPLLKVGGKLMVGGGSAAVEAAIAEAG